MKSSLQTLGLLTSLTLTAPDTQNFRFEDTDGINIAMLERKRIHAALDRALDECGLTIESSTKASDPITCIKETHERLSYELSILPILDDIIKANEDHKETQPSNLEATIAKL